MLHDLVTTLRSLVRRPKDSLGVILPLALGIGPALAVFALVHLLLAGPLGIPEGDRVVSLTQNLPRLGGESPMSSAAYLTLLEHHSSAEPSPFTALAAYRTDSRTLTDAGRPVRVEVANVSPSFFELTRVRPQVGRWPTEDEARLAAGQGTILDDGRSVVLGHDLWRQRFGARRDLVGRQVTLDGRRFEVVGVMPPGFDFPHDTEAWVTLGFGEVAPRDWGGFYLQVLGRLDPQATEARTAQLLESTAASIQPRAPDLTGEMDLVATPLRELRYGRYQTPSLILLALTLLIVVGVSSSGAQLLWARTLDRRGDLALRMALGTSRPSLSRLVFFEGLLLSLAGLTLGVGLASVILAIFERADLLALDASPTLGAEALGFAALITLIGGALLGLAPLLALAPGQLGRQILETASRSARAHSTSGVRRLLLAAQIALALVLVVSGLVLLESFDRLSSVSLGFEPAHLSTLDLELPPERYPPDAIRPFVAQTLDQLDSLPGAEGSAASLRSPVLDSGGGIWFDVPPGGVAGAKGVPATFNAVTAGFFDVLGTSVVTGRGIEPGDRAGGEPVVVVDETLAREHYEGKAVGRTLVLTPWPDVERRIVGVAPALRYDGLEAAPGPAIYVPMEQLPIGQLRFFVRHHPDRPPSAEVLLERLAAVDDHLAATHVGPLEARLDHLLAPERWAMRLVLVLAVLGLLLSVFAVYSATSQMVSQRVQELGIRAALGCSRSGLVRHVVASRLPDLLAGLALGAAGVWGVGRWARSILYDVSPYEPFWIFAGLVLLLGSAILATVLPARRAARADPATLLR